MHSAITSPTRYLNTSINENQRHFVTTRVRHVVGKRFSIALRPSPSAVFFQNPAPVNAITGILEFHPQSLWITLWVHRDERR
jgi:hypothetical protein